MLRYDFMHYEDWEQKLPQGCYVTQYKGTPEQRIVMIDSFRSKGSWDARHGDVSVCVCTLEGETFYEDWESNTLDVLTVPSRWWVYEGHWYYTSFSASHNYRDGIFNRDVRCAMGHSSPMRGWAQIVSANEPVPEYACTIGNVLLVKRDIFNKYSIEFPYISVSDGYTMDAQQVKESVSESIKNKRIIDFNWEQKLEGVVNATTQAV